jgi:hypothetical protein
MHRTLLIALLHLAGAAPACAHGAEQLVRSGAQGGIGGGLTALNDPENKALLLRLLQDEDIRRAAHDLTAALTGGALDGLSEEARVQRVRDASDVYIRTIAAAASEAIGEDLSPAVTKAVADVIGGAVSSALRPANRRLAEALVDGVTRSTIAAFAQSTAQGLREDLGPALQKVLAEDVGPGLQKVVEDNLGPALRKVVEHDLQPALAAALTGEDGRSTGLFARALTKQIVLGVNDGLSEMGLSPSPNRKDGLGVTGWLLIVAAVLLVGLGALLTRVFITRRALAQDRVRSEAMLVDILRAIEAPDAEAPGRPKSLADVLARVNRRAPGFDGDNSYLATIVGRARLPPTPGVPPA